MSYHESFSSGSAVQREFQHRGLRPRVIARTTDATVIKAYVAAGIGIAIIPTRAVNATEDAGIRIVQTAEALPSPTAVISARKDQMLRSFAYELINMIAPRWTADAARIEFRGSRPAR